MAKMTMVEAINMADVYKRQPCGMSIVMLDCHNPGLIESSANAVATKPADKTTAAIFFMESPWRLRLLWCRENEGSSRMPDAYG